MKESIGFMKERASDYVNAIADSVEIERKIEHLKGELAIKHGQISSLRNKLISEGQNVYILDAVNPGRIVVVVKHDNGLMVEVHREVK